MLSWNSTSKVFNYGGIAILVAVEASVVSQHHDKLVPIVVATVIALGAWLSWLGPVGGGRPIRLWQVIGMGIAAVILAGSSAEGAAIIPAVVAIAASTRLDRRTSAVFAAIMILAFLAATGLSLGFQPISLFSYGLGLAFAYLAARSNQDLRQEQQRTKALLVELQATREAQLQGAALNERSRIAREIHDVLAHTLAALSVQLENARVILSQHGSEHEAIAAVERAHHLAREGLNETRQAVSTLRGDAVPGADQLEQLVDTFQRDTGVSARLRVDGASRPLDAEVELAVYRTAQEALTNVRKHATPDQVDVLIRYQPDATELRIQDHGPRAALMQENGGYGLVGMRERAELLGGTLDAHPTDDGFLVTLRLPM